MNDSESKLAPGEVFHGRYRVDRLLKAGGMGAVYEAFDQTTNGRRALKVMLETALEGSELYKRFMDEVRLAGSLESNHVVKVYDAGVDEATKMPFMVMELLVGDDLAAVAKREAKLQRPLRWHDVVKYLRHAALALDKVHALNIVHRDIKPQNLFLTRYDDGEPCVKLIDFGIAMFDATDKSQTGQIGTLKYMAPEQVRGERKRIVPATDVFALAQTAYTLLVGEPYWTEEEKDNNLVDLLEKRMTEAPVARALRRNKVELPDAFDAWFNKAAAADPTERFAKATECIAALAELLGHGQGRGQMHSDITKDPTPPPPAPPSPPVLLVQGGTSSGSQTEKDDVSPPRELTKSNTGNTSKEVTVDPVPKSKGGNGAIIGGGLAFAGMLVLAGVIWLVNGRPKDPGQGILPPNPIETAAPVAPSATGPGSPAPPASSATPIIAPPPPPPPPIDAGGGGSVKPPPSRDAGPPRDAGSGQGPKPPASSPSISDKPDWKKQTVAP